MNKEWIEEKLFNVNDKLSAKRCRKEWFEKYGFGNKYEELIQKTEFLEEDVKPGAAPKVIKNMLLL